MSKKAETVYKEKLVPKLRAIPDVWVLKTQEVATVGVLDLFLCVNGAFVVIELKKSLKEKPSPLQEYNARKIKEAGGISLVSSPEVMEQTLSHIAYISIYMENLGNPTRSLG